MLNPPTPATETARLRCLRGLELLDTPPEERFDRYTRLAQRLFAVPVAQIAFVDEGRQWIKSQSGESIAATSRAQSFCAHAILDPGVTVVEDAREDARFASNPLVSGEPGIRFYAGVPLAAPDGHRLGTLCIMDFSARKLSPEDLEPLADLARLVERELAAHAMYTLDELTGVSNRRGLSTLAEQALKVCDRHCEPASLLFVSMSDPGAIIDRYGHGAGNGAVKEFAGLLLEAFRESDIIARLRGTEFCVLLTGAGTGQTRECAQRFERLLAQRNARNDQPWQLHGVNISVEYDRSRHHSLDDLLDEARNRLFVMQRGDGQAVVEDPAVA